MKFVVVSTVMFSIILASPLLAVTSCKPVMTPEDEKHVDNHGKTLMRCMDEGRDSGSYAVFDACKKDAGIEK